MGKSKRSPAIRREELWDEPCRPSATPPRAVELLGGQSVLPPGAPAPAAGVSGCPSASEVTTVLEDDVSPTMLVALPVLSPAEAAAWIAWGEAKGFAIERHAQTMHIAHRDNGRLAVESDAIAAAIFERLRPWVPARIGRRVPVGCSPNIRLYRYGVGQRFGRHVDLASRLASGGVTEFTVLLYLSDVGDGLAGGETLFYADHHAKEPLYRFAPCAGAALVHAHGDRCLTHEGAAVAAGVKYLLRTDLAYALPGQAHGPATH